MAYDTYHAYNAGKVGADFMLPGLGDAASSMKAKAKADLLEEILQQYFQSRGERYDNSEIRKTDVKKSILYVISKKQVKAARKGVESALKIGAATTGLTVGMVAGSVVPVAGTAAGGLVGYASGVGAGALVTGGSWGRRGLKKAWKFARSKFGMGSGPGEHRGQAAACLVHMACRNDESASTYAAQEALIVILDVEFEPVILADGGVDVGRVAERLKSV